MVSILFSELPRAKVKPAKFSYYLLLLDQCCSFKKVVKLKDCQLQARVSSDFPAGRIQALSFVLHSWSFKIQAISHHNNVEEKFPTSPNTMLVLTSQSGFVFFVCDGPQILLIHLSDIHVFKNILSITLSFCQFNIFLETKSFFSESYQSASRYQ